MRADKYLSIDGLYESVMVGQDNKLPALDASNLTNITQSLGDTVPEIISTVPVVTEADIGRIFLYTGSYRIY